MNVVSVIARAPGSKIALIEGASQTTFEQLRDRAALIAGGLRALGVSRGDRVAVIGDNTIELVEALLGVFWIGAVAVPLNPHDPTPSLLHELEVVGTSLVIATGSVVLPEPTRLVRPSDLVGSPVDMVECDDDDLAVLIFTSGTAGAPRAAMLSHANLLANQRQAQSVSDPLVESDVVLCALPIFHIFGLNVALLQSLAVGATVVLVPQFSTAATRDAIADSGVTVLPGVPAMFGQLLDDPLVTEQTMGSIRLALSGAAALAHDVFELARTRWGILIAEGYGLTEAAPVVTTSIGIDPVPGSIGRVLAGVEVRLVDDGNDALVGDAGEIWVRGDNVFRGYWNDPQATAAVLTADGWLRTGDVATVDGDGRLWLVDRVKDLIIVSGFNVYPAEVEAALASHNVVAETVVVGVPSDTTGEAVKAYIVRSPGAAGDASGLIEHCRGQIARYKCPTILEFVEELPRGVNGKVLRRLLR